MMTVTVAFCIEYHIKDSAVNSKLFVNDTHHTEFHSKAACELYLRGSKEESGQLRNLAFNKLRDISFRKSRNFLCCRTTGVLLGCL